MKLTAPATFFMSEVCFSSELFSCVHSSAFSFLSRRSRSIVCRDQRWGQHKAGCYWSYSKSVAHIFKRTSLHLLISLAPELFCFRHAFSLSTLISTISEDSVGMRRILPLLLLLSLRVARGRTGVLSLSSSSEEMTMTSSSRDINEVWAAVLFG